METLGGKQGNCTNRTHSLAEKWTSFPVEMDMFPGGNGMFPGGNGHVSQWKHTGKQVNCTSHTNQILWQEIKTLCKCLPIDTQTVRHCTRQQNNQNDECGCCQKKTPPLMYTAKVCPQKLPARAT